MRFQAETAHHVDGASTQCKFVLTKNKVLLIDLLGVVSRASMESTMALIRRTASGRADAFCLHMDKALMTVSQACADEINPAGAQGISGAIVVRGDALDLAHRHVGRMAQHGIVREAFTSRAAALVWAEHQAQLARDQRLWVLALR